MKKLNIVIISLLVAAFFLASYAYADTLWSEGIRKEFEVANVVPLCDRESWVWKNWSEGELKQWSSLTRCYEDTGTPPICCPEGYVCKYDVDPSDPNFMKCIPVTYVLNYCEEYAISLFGSEAVAKAECESAPPKIAADSISRIQDYPEDICKEGYREINNSDSNCFRYTNCLCYWENGNCSSGVKYSPWYCDVPGDDDDKKVDDGTDGICVLEKSSVQGDCSKDSDFITITWQRVWKSATAGAIAPPECAEGVSRNIACPSKLAFFTILSFFVTAVVIVVIYAFKSSRKKRK